MNWAEIWTELRNKFRWSLSSTAYSKGIWLSYSAGKGWAGQLADAALEELKTMHHSRNGTTAEAGDSGEQAKVSS